jgi:hypothetical protein
VAEAIDAIAAQVAALLAVPGEIFALRREVRDLSARLDALSAASPPALVDVETYAGRIHVSPATIRRWLVAGTLPGMRAGRKWMVDAAAVRPTRPEEIAELAAEARAR